MKKHTDVKLNGWDVMKRKKYMLFFLLGITPNLITPNLQRFYIDRILYNILKSLAKNIEDCKVFKRTNIKKQNVIFAVMRDFE